MAQYILPKKPIELINSNLLILDFDGVLNDHKTAGKFTVEAKFVANLAKIVRETNCYIIISSSWREYGIGKDSKLDIAIKSVASEEDYNLIRDAIIDETPWRFSGSRDSEITLWFTETFIENKLKFKGTYVVLDDQHLYNKNLIQTSYYGDNTGLNDRITSMVIKRFNISKESN